MKKVFVIQCVATLLCVMFVASCGGGGSVGAKAGKEVCDCMVEIQKKQSQSSGDGFEDFGLAFEAVGCIMAVSEKYKEHFDADNNFKNPKDQKDFETALKKCAPDFAKQMMGE